MLVAVVGVTPVGALLRREMARRTSRRETDAVAREQVDRVVEATRVVGALIAESLVSLEPALTMPQWRVLVLANEGDCNVSGRRGSGSAHVQRDSDVRQVGR